MSTLTVEVKSAFNPADLVFYVVDGGSVKLGVVDAVRLDEENKVVYDIKTGGTRAVSRGVPEGSVLFKYPSCVGGLFEAINAPIPSPVDYAISMKILNDSGSVTLSDLHTIDERLDKLRTPWNGFANGDFVTVHDKMEGGAGVFYLYRVIGYDRVPDPVKSNFNIIVRRVYVDGYNDDPIGFPANDRKVLLFAISSCFSGMIENAMKEYERMNG